MTPPSSPLEQVVVLTGSIGSGKSTAARYFADCGALILSADELAREVVKAGSPALSEICKRFGEGFLLPNKELDRKKLAAKVFSDPAAKKALEQITHPRIHELARTKFAELAKRGAPLLLYDCPLYFEAGLSERGFGPVVLVATEVPTAKKRALARGGLSAEEFDQRYSAQLPTEKKRELANYVIENNASPEELREKVLKLFETLRRR